MIFGLVPVVVVPKVAVVWLDTLLYATPVVILSTCTVQPVARLVPVIPFVVVAHPKVGMAGLLLLLQVLAVTALLVRQSDSPPACAFAVITSPLASVTLGIDHELPEAIVPVVCANGILLPFLKI